MFGWLRIVTLSTLVLIGACSDDKSADLGRLLIISNDRIIEYNVEVANTRDKLYQGLMGRNQLAEESGMLLDINIVPKDIEEIAMWMKDTIIPLDMLFIDDNGRIYFIKENAEPYSTTPIQAPKRPRAVLEINGGQVSRYGIKIGDIVKNNMFNNM